uniref:Putative chaperone n=1 Tax=viral metagenome TaxID=1070528 RepID=A0A6M3KB03_9ZZZZ
MAIPILVNCERCNGTGIITYVGYETPTTTCTACNGTGKIESGYIPDVDSTLTTIIAKCEEIKTKQNRMQADINYIKAKV